MSKLPYLPLFTNDWLASAKITLMTPAEEGAYIRLLCLAWNDDRCSLPADDASLAAMSRLGNQWLESAPRILACFEEHDGRLYNEKLLECWQESHTRRDKKSAGGVKGMLTRWGNRDSKPVITELKDTYPVVNNIPITSTLPLLYSTSTTTPFQNKKEKKGRQAPPFLTEWLEYAGSIGYDKTDAEGAWNHYEANGWRQKGGNPIKSWQAACRTCKSHSVKYAANQSAPHKSFADIEQERVLEIMRASRHE